MTLEISHEDRASAGKPAIGGPALVKTFQDLVEEFHPVMEG
jgi:hypothetical protein